ncbi:MAG: flagellar hook assembly protein FlgD [Geminicoccaceae bacterium]
MSAPKMPGRSLCQDEPAISVFSISAPDVYCSKPEEITMEIGAIPSTAATKENDKDRVGLADNFDSFLKLLTTQLQNQDPTSPLDADQFTQQLVQFSGVEQQIRSNETLAQLASLMQANQLGQSVGYLGAEVEAEGDIVRLGDDGSAKVHYELDGPASAVTVKISDELGQTIATFAGETGGGRHSLTWDGFGDDGVRHSEGAFKIDVVAENATGDPVEASTMITGLVDGVEFGDGQTLLSVDGVLMPLDRVTAVRTPTSTL